MLSLQSREGYLHARVVGTEVHVAIFTKATKMPMTAMILDSDDEMQRISAKILYRMQEAKSESLPTLHRKRTT